MELYSSHKSEAARKIERLEAEIISYKERLKEREEDDSV